MNREIVDLGPYNPRTMSLFVPAIKLTGQGTLLFMSGTGPLPASHKHPHVPRNGFYRTMSLSKRIAPSRRYGMVVEARWRGNVECCEDHALLEGYG